MKFIGWHAYIANLSELFHCFGYVYNPTYIIKYFTSISYFKQDKCDFLQIFRLRQMILWEYPTLSHIYSQLSKSFQDPSQRRHTIQAIDEG